MLHRLMIAGIVAFWAVMTGLLVRTELFPEAEAAWRQIPTEHVLTILFENAEYSDLNCYYGMEKVGAVSFYPKMLENGNRQFGLRGESLMGMTQDSMRPVFFDMLLKMTSDYSVQHLTGSINIRKPSMQLAIELNPETEQFSYTLTEEAQVLQSDSGKIQDLLARGLPPNLGIDNVFKQAMTGFPARDTKIYARLGTLKVQDEKIDVFKLIFRHAEDLETEVSISQVGRILSVETPFPFRLVAEGVNLTP